MREENRRIVDRRNFVETWARVKALLDVLEDAEEKLRYDLYYVKNMNPLFDLNIILRTVGVILFGKGAR